MKKGAKIALTVGAASVASVAAWAASRAIVKPTKRKPKEMFERKTQHILQYCQHFDHLPTSHGIAVRIQLTKDEQLIALPMSDDPHIDVTDLTLQQALQQQPLHATTCVPLKDLVTDRAKQTVLLQIDHAPDTYEGSLIPSKLWNFLELHHCTDHVIVSSPYAEQIDRFNLYAQHSVVLAASDDEMLKAFTAYTSAFGHFYKPNVDVFILREKMLFLPTLHEGFISFLHDLNIRVFYDISTSKREDWIKKMTLPLDGWVVQNDEQWQQLNEQLNIEI